MKIEIEFLEDETDCDLCGPTYCTGFLVYFDGELRLDLKPVASCTDARTYSVEETTELILQELGHEVVYK